MNPGDGSDWVKETHCAVKAEWKFIFLWFYIYFFCFGFCFLLYFMYYIEWWTLGIPGDGDFLGLLLLAW